MIWAYIHDVVHRLNSYNITEEAIVYYETLWYLFCYIGICDAGPFENTHDVEQWVIESLIQEHLDGYLQHPRHGVTKKRLVVLNRYIGLLDLPLQLPVSLKRHRPITNTDDFDAQNDSKCLRNRLLCAMFKDLCLSRSQIQSFRVLDAATYINGYWHPLESLEDCLQTLIELYLNQRRGQQHLDYRDSSMPFLFVSSHSGQKMKLNTISKIIRNATISANVSSRQGTQGHIRDTQNMVYDS